MPIAAQFAVSGSVQGRSYGVSTNINSGAALQIDESCLVGQAGSLTTRTNNTVGTVTLTVNAVTLVTSDVADVYWSGGMRRGVVLGTVAGTSCPLTDSGSGDNLPVVNTAVVVSPTRVVNTSIVGANVKSITIDSASDQDGAYSILASGVETLGAKLVGGADYIWFDGNGITNPVTGSTQTQIRVSQGGVTANNVIRGSIQYG